MRNNSTSTQSRGPRRIQGLYQHLQVPPSLTPLADALYANTAVIDTGKLDNDMYSVMDPDRARMLDALAVTVAKDGTRPTTRLAVSDRSHALVELAGGSAWQVLTEYLLPRPGTTLVSVSGDTRPFPVLAHLSGDLRLAEAVASGDVYTWFAEQANIPRLLAKMGLFEAFFGMSRNQLVEAVHLMADELDDYALDADTFIDGIAATIADTFPDAVAYLASQGEYVEKPWRNVQATTNRIANATLAYAHLLITDGRLAVPVAYAGHAEVVYEVPTNRLDELKELLEGCTVTREGITAPIEVDVLRARTTTSA